MKISTIIPTSLLVFGSGFAKPAGHEGHHGMMDGMMDGMTDGMMDGQDMHGHHGDMMSPCMMLH